MNKENLREERNLDMEKKEDIIAEIKNALQVILGKAELIERTSAQYRGEIAANARIIQEQTMRIAKLLRNLWSFGKF